MTAAIKHARADKFCLRCESLGIPTPTILADMDYVAFKPDTDNEACCCMDCFERLHLEYEEGRTA